MSRFYKGMVIHTSYGSGPYIISKVTDNCTCPSFLDSLNLRESAPKSRPHCHLTCKGTGHTYNNKGTFWLNGYDENGVNVWRPDDRIIVDAEETLLLTMVCGM